MCKVLLRRSRFGVRQLAAAFCQHWIVPCLIGGSTRLSVFKLAAPARPAILPSVLPSTVSACHLVSLAHFDELLGQRIAVQLGTVFRQWNAQPLASRLTTSNARSPCSSIWLKTGRIDLRAANATSPPQRSLLAWPVHSVQPRTRERYRFQGMLLDQRRQGFLP